MVVGIDISPIVGNSDHKIRGVGSYINLLMNNIAKYDKKNEFVFISDPKNIAQKIDILHIPYFDPFFLHLPLQKKAKLVVTIHDLIPVVHKEHFPVGVKGYLKWNINKRLVSQVDAIIVDSDASGNEVTKLLKIKRDKVFTIYLSANEELKNISQKKSQRILSKYNLPKKYFLYVGDVTWNKNLPRLISAIKKVKIPIVMVGKNLAGDNFDESNPWNKDRVIVRNQISNNGLFIKLGFINNEELSALYSDAIALCMPSLDEGFGLPVLEAMKCNCPVLVSQLGSLPEVAGEAGEYIDAYSSDSIAKSLSKIYYNPGLRREMIEKGQQQSSKFTIQDMMQKTINVYKNI